MKTFYYRLAGIIFLSSALFLPGAVAGADQIVLAADRWCPINCEPDSTEPGIMVEIAREIFSQAGHRVEYRLMPWARAIKEAREGNITGIIGAFEGDAPDFIFPDRELLMVSGNVFFVSRESDWDYKDTTSLSDIILGAILEYDYGETINSYIKTHLDSKQVQLISGNDPLERNISKLLRGRVDVLIEASPVFWYTASKMGVKDKLRSAGEASAPEKCFIAFSPAIEKSEEYAKILSDGIEKLRESGKLQEILDKYGFMN